MMIEEEELVIVEEESVEVVNDPVIVDSVPDNPHKLPEFLTFDDKVSWFLE